MYLHVNLHRFISKSKQKEVYFYAYIYAKVTNNP